MSAITKDVRICLFNQHMHQGSFAATCCGKDPYTLPNATSDQAVNSPNPQYKMGFVFRLDPCMTEEKRQSLVAPVLPISCSVVSLSTTCPEGSNTHPNKEELSIAINELPVGQITASRDKPLASPIRLNTKSDHD
ncbi:Uncharacterised protein [Serratia fonticola]|uniref:Uncharacterized protein n=1 Tax=Serratia fonticola TaxID=47917 RepID=A0A4U9V2U8_SERFO|nr:Uncharacterised protein [Serratia fonticola]